MNDIEQDQQVAAAFIAEQRAKFENFNVTGMTRRQRARVKALDVVPLEERIEAIVWCYTRKLGPAPHGDTGRMRVIDMNTGEIREQRAPARKLDIGHEPHEDDVANVVPEVVL